MAALVADGRALAVGSIVSVVISIVLCMLSVSLVNWSALRQVSHRTLYLFIYWPTAFTAMYGFALRKTA